MMLGREYFHPYEGWALVCKTGDGKFASSLISRSSTLFGLAGAMLLILLLLLSYSSNRSNHFEMARTFHVM